MRATVDNFSERARGSRTARGRPLPRGRSRRRQAVSSPRERSATRSVGAAPNNGKEGGAGTPPVPRTLAPATAHLVSHARVDHAHAIWPRHDRRGLDAGDHQTGAAQVPGRPQYGFRRSRRLNASHSSAFSSTALKDSPSSAATSPATTENELQKSGSARESAREYDDDPGCAKRRRPPRAVTGGRRTVASSLTIGRPAEGDNLAGG